MCVEFRSYTQEKRERERRKRDAHRSASRYFILLFPVSLGPARNVTPLRTSLWHTTKGIHKAAQGEREYSLERTQAIG